MNVWHDVSAGKNLPEKMNCIIEVPTGSNNKYEIDKETGLLMMDRVLNSVICYPTNYGLVPRTLAKDGDPLDVLLLSTNAILPMTLVEVRPLGMLIMIDQGDEDQKVIAVPCGDPRFAEYRTLDDVPVATLAEIEDFFRTYKYLEKPEADLLKLADKKVEGAPEPVNYAVKGTKKVEVVGYVGLEETKKLILETCEDYAKKFGA
ncbi:inorganic pyrophosphatase [Candidatus Peregrinibacteria bacterium HGW-Peregrinibacteria-1]|jgi:inorganic pyrophosphatase|nr:MAG: inorganic pyrophosphatase [Candidatus Peregrinibacteria bacterium HGW-Peregrinibacteria-1]